MRKRDLNEGAKVSGSDMTYRELLKQKLDQLKEVKNEKRQVVDELHAIQDQLEDFHAKRENNM